MAGVPAEVQDVPLGDPHVLQKLPERVGQRRRSLPSSVLRYLAECVSRAPVSPALFQELDDVLPEFRFLAHAVGPFGDERSMEMKCTCLRS